ncbi:hypothetical protein OMCYN_01639 [cyanobiont of Ornithocercus magnificus]|nr:hypothetical protein OMCYN_01639 [cyanobiont of Ornithocercus magnificus]
MALLAADQLVLHQVVQSSVDRPRADVSGEAAQDLLAQLAGWQPGPSCAVGVDLAAFVAAGDLYPALDEVEADASEGFLNTDHGPMG